MASGFFEQKKTSPVGFGVVVALHAAAIGGVLLIKAPQWMAERNPPTRTYNVPIEPPPPPEPKPVEEQVSPQAPQLSRVDVMPPIILPRDPAISVPIDRGVTPPGPIVGSDPIGTGTVEPRVIAEIPVREPVRAAVRVDAQFASGASLQPPYPSSEVRREREGSVRIRVTIGADGRVKSTERLSATSDAFWEATRQQALNHWRFRPATLDGRAVESVKVLTIQFRLDN